jgi:hypothetical protein
MGSCEDLLKLRPQLQKPEARTTEKQQRLEENIVAAAEEMIA